MKKQITKSSLLLGVALGLSSMPISTTQAAAAPGKVAKPNIIFIFADDQCWNTINSLGNKEIHTPNLDRLVNNGVSFVHAHNMGSWCGAVCVASRTMLNTGRSLWRTHELCKTKTTGAKPTWSQMVRSAGYRTYMTGKWHVRGIKAEQHFDVAKDVRGGMPRQTKAGYNRPKGPDDKNWLPWDKKRGGYWKGGKHWSEVVGDNSIKFIKEAQKDKQPFFMYLAFNAPHDPRQSPKKFVDMYPLKKIKVPKNFLPEYPYNEIMGSGRKLRDEKLAPFPRTKYSVKVNRQEYYAIITHMDKQIGRILDALKKSGKEKNTYIFFTADHGLAVGHHGLIGKQNMFEHSMRPPLIVCGPGIAKNKKINAPVYLQDIMPTTLQLAGAKVPERVEYKSLLPLLEGKVKKTHDIIYGAYKNTQRMVKKGKWKLITYPKGKVYLLFNLQDDPDEMVNLAANPKYSAKLADMKAFLRAAEEKYNDPILASK